MAFTGKCTYTAGTTIPEVAEDVGDLVTILSPRDAAARCGWAIRCTRRQARGTSGWTMSCCQTSGVIAQPGLNDTAARTPVADRRQWQPVPHRRSNPGRCKARSDFHHRGDGQHADAGAWL